MHWIIRVVMYCIAILFILYIGAMVWLLSYDYVHFIYMDNVGNAERVTGILPVADPGTLAEDGTAGAVSFEVVIKNPGDQSLKVRSS